MFKRVLVASVLVVVGSIASEARPLRTTHAPECNVTMPCDFSFSPGRGDGPSGSTPSPPRISSQPLEQLRAVGGRVVVASVDTGSTQIVGGRPAGCPRSFCGCGAAIRVFGRIVPELNLAANWLRFPRTSPAPGMVAARRGHVLVLERAIGGDVWMAYDANSGGHATRIHAVSLRGYAIVNPHAT